MSVVGAVEQEDLTAEHRDAAALATMAGHALLELREELSRRGHVGRFWDFEAGDRL